MTPIAGMKNVAGSWCLSRRSRILGTNVVAPYSPTDKGTGRGFARCSNSLSTSKERQTATRAPLGQVLGVSFLPTLAVPTACRICSSVESTVIGFTAAAGGWRDESEAPSAERFERDRVVHVRRVRRDDRELLIEQHDVRIPSAPAVESR